MYPPKLTIDMKAINHVTKAAATVWLCMEEYVSNTMYENQQFTEHDIKYTYSTIHTTQISSLGS